MNSYKYVCMYVCMYVRYQLQIWILTSMGVIAPYK